MRGMSAASARSRSLVVAVVAGVVTLAALVGLVFWGAFSLFKSNESQEQVVAESTVAVSEAPVASASAELVVADGTCVDPASVDRSDPDKVAEAVISIAFCFDSVLDTNTTDALRRAEPLMTENMSVLLNHEKRATRNALSAQFLEAGKQRGYTYTKVQYVGSDAHHHHDGEESEGGHDHARDDEGGVHVSSQYVKWTWVPRDGSGEMDGGYAVWTMNLVQNDAGEWALDSFSLGSFEPAF